MTSFNYFTAVESQWDGGQYVAVFILFFPHTEFLFVLMSSFSLCLRYALYQSSGFTPVWPLDGSLEGRAEGDDAPLLLVSVLPPPPHPDFLSRAPCSWFFPG